MVSAKNGELGPNLINRNSIESIKIAKRLPAAMGRLQWEGS